MMKKNILTPHEIVEYAIRIDQIGMTLNEGLLLEKIDADAALNLSKSNDKLLEMLAELENAFAGKIKSVDDEIGKLKTGAQKSVDLLKKLSSASGKGGISSEKILSKIKSFFRGSDDPKATLNAVLLLQSRAQELVEILKYAMPKIIEKIEAAKIDKKSTDKLWAALQIDKDSELNGALKDLLTQSRPGIFKSVGNFFKSLNVNKDIINDDEKVDYDKIAAEMSELSVADFVSIAEGTASIKTDGGEDVKDSVKDFEDAIKSDEEGEEGAEGEEGEEDAEDPNAEQVKDAVQDAEKSKGSPKDAVAGALEGWYDALSPTSQKQIKVKNRLGTLRDAIFGGVDDSIEALTKSVEDAIKKWRSENEDSLLKSKRFAKKDFDALQNLVPGLVASIAKKTNESKHGLVDEDVRKIVFHILDKRAAKKSGILNEESRWMLMAGLRGDSN